YGRRSRPPLGPPTKKSWWNASTRSVMTIDHQAATLFDPDVAMANPQTVDRQTFLTNLRQSGLVSGDQMAKVVHRLPNTDKGLVLARSMVELGLITRFQAELLLVGRTSGFHLGQYLIMDQLGRGGMGRVFRAQHVTMNRIVAIKVLAPHLCKT